MHLHKRSIPSLLGANLLILAPALEGKTEDQGTISPNHLAQQAGTAAGTLYCKSTSFETSLEQGIMLAVLQSGLPMNELNEKLDFDSDAVSQAMIIGMIDYTIDHCPERAKQIFRDFRSISP